MAKIQSSVEINAPIDKVWKIISDLDNETKYWKGTKAIRNISKEDDNKIKREVTIAFRDSKCIQEVILHPKEKVEIVFTEGIIKGVKILSLTPINDKILLEARWDIKFSGMMNMFTGMIKKHVESGTRQAIDSIKKEAER